MDHVFQESLLIYRNFVRVRERLHRKIKYFFSATLVLVMCVVLLKQDRNTNSKDSILYIDTHLIKQTWRTLRV